jgi:hypothetical protein
MSFMVAISCCLIAVPEHGALPDERKHAIGRIDAGFSAFCRGEPSEC